MKRTAGVMVVALVSMLSAGRPQAQQAPQVIPHDPPWAFPIAEMQLPPEPATAKHLEGSSKSYLPKEIDDLSNPPDWFPSEHPPAPSVVQKGHGDALACGACHLMNDATDPGGWPGMGRPSVLAGGLTSSRGSPPSLRGRRDRVEAAGWFGGEAARARA